MIELFFVTCLINEPQRCTEHRLLFEERLAQELLRAPRTGERVAVFAIDLDDFKSINDRFGHAGGDEALRAAAQLLSACVRLLGGSTWP